MSVKADVRDIRGAAARAAAEKQNKTTQEAVGVRPMAADKKPSGATLRAGIPFLFGGEMVKLRRAQGGCLGTKSR